MSYTLEIDITEDIDDAVAAALDDIQAAIDRATESRSATVTRTHEVDLDALLQQERKIAHVWSCQDVRTRRPDLTDDQTWEVLQQVERRLDSNLGITWLTIEAVAEELFPEAAARQAERVTRMQNALEGYNPDWDEAANLTDLLTDARHWCDARGFDFYGINGAAYDHYLAERQGKE